MNRNKVIKSIVNDKETYNASTLIMVDVINLLTELPIDSELCFFDNFQPPLTDIC